MRIKRILMVCLTFSVIFSSSAVANYWKDTYDICHDVAETVNIYEILEQYNHGDITETDLFKQFILTREITFTSLKLWNLLWWQAKEGETGALEEAVLNFFGTRIGAIAYAINMIGAGKMKNEEPTKEFVIALKLAQAQLSTHQKVLEELGKELEREK